jgi:hypothetical protein
MMKRILIFAVVLSLLVPAAAFAATEFSLGGYIKLDAYWDSTNQGKNINGTVNRNNDPSFHHGNLRFTAQGSRFNFTIKGPEVLGAKLTGFIEMDFDSCTDVGSISNAPGGQSSSNNYIPRLRHAMFRMNWPGDTELLFGQYWSMFCDWFPEVAEDGPFQVTGIPTARLPQIRFTQGFACDWKVAGLIGQANNDYGIFSGNPYSTTVNNGGSAETPQIQGQLKYAHDWWGKAAFYGHPIPLTASVTAGWQRNVVRPGDQAVVGVDLTGGANNAYFGHRYVSPWMIQGSLFIPVIPTHSDDLTGTAHLLVQPYIGRGIGAYGMAGDATNVFKFASNFSSFLRADPELLDRYGLMAEAQYYFTNQWFLNAAYAITAAMNFNEYKENVPGWGNVPKYLYNGANQVRSMQQVDATLWYQPIKALKFGIQYSYVHCEYLLDAYPGGTVPVWGQNGSLGHLANLADEHRVEFVGFFFF